MNAMEDPFEHRIAGRRAVGAELRADQAGAATDIEPRQLHRGRRGEDGAHAASPGEVRQLRRVEADRNRR